MSKDKSAPLLATNIWNFYTIFIKRPIIFFTHCHLFQYSIYSRHFRLIKQYTEGKEPLINIDNSKKST